MAVSCERGTPVPPQGVLANDDAGLVINQRSTMQGEQDMMLHVMTPLDAGQDVAAATLLFTKKVTAPGLEPVKNQVLCRAWTLNPTP